MRNNIFNLFLNKFLSLPFYIKLVMFFKLKEEMHTQACENLLKSNDTIFSTYIPTITFKGKTELEQRKCGFDSNIYNFLKCCTEDLCILEISVNTFLSLEETAKYYEFCLEQGFINPPESPEITAMAGYLSGKLRIGEYFKQKGIIDSQQLSKALESYQSSDDKMFGEILVLSGFISENDLKAILLIKEEAQKRFILDYNSIPQVQTSFSDNIQHYENEIKALKEENCKLKQKMIQLSELVRKNAKS